MKDYNMFEVSIAKNLFRDAIQSIFPREHIAYAFLTGPFTFGSAKHDIDIVVVIDEDKLQPFEKEKYIEKILTFVEKYLRIHKFLGYIPDLDFPSDVVTTSQIEDAINGRGFDIKNDKLYLREIKTKEDYLDNKIDYRVYLWELITSYEGFILGNYPKYIVDMQRALETILLFCLSNIEENETTLECIKEKIIVLPGLDSRYKVISNYLEPLIKYMLKIMNSQGYIVNKENYFLLNKEKIQQWESSIIKRHKENRWKGKSLFESWDILRLHAKKIINDFL